MQTGEYEIRRLTTFRVEFDGRIAAVAREESNDTCKTQDDAIVLHVRLVLPTRAYGANSTPEGEADAPPELLSSCSKRPYSPVQNLVISLLIQSIRNWDAPTVKCVSSVPEW